MNTDKCDCHLPTKPPEGIDWWFPVVDEEPDPPITTVVRFGEDPEMRRAVRVPGGWAEHGAMVNFYEAITPPMPWEHVGHCWADTPHPVVAVRQERDGTWTTRTRVP